MKHDPLPYAAGALLLACACAALFAFYIEWTSNAPMSWGSLRVIEATSVKVVVLAETPRTGSKGCSNGIQADLRRDETVTKLTPPERTSQGETSAYVVELPSLTPAKYDLRLRETFHCGGRPKVAESPWFEFEVKRDEARS